ncbi:DUF3179 domain-containing (seleno)protein [Flagellimonas pacifica]|uniref:DUF3179 domain-containing protein n=1 Tax=Flagellimonas pacifica TaxID=1247520 RepID=A0A285MTK1_9FLAO|nr:DUF3179 domain-containing (seleno)protein [Allomuricauda parva]SNZ00504.1 Protein of unknown function [Allomuricauda parva]
MKAYLSLLIMLCCFLGFSQRPSALENGKFFEKDGTKMLYGGEKASQHFIIDNLDLKPGQFHYGIGRERFPALLKPEFQSVQEADSHWTSESRFLLAKKGDDIKAYSVTDLTRHEVVNDMLAGEPIFAAYCILADLGAVYKRTYADKVFTFALSGYTYFDPKVWNGLDGFVLWDRETKSLWWPLVDKAVSGSLKNVKLQKLEDIYWEDTTWEHIKENYPNAKVMKSGLDYERPKTWKRYDDVSDIVKNIVTESF